LASKAGIPYVGSYGTVPTEFTTPGVFPLNCGFVGWVYGGTKNLVAKGAKKISVISLNNAPGAYGAKLSEQALGALGMKPAATVLADPQADPTFSTAAAKATSNGVDGIFITLVPPLMPKLLKALQNAGYKGKISAISALATPAILKAAGPTADGMFVTGQAAFAADAGNPGIKGFLTDMKKYQPNGALAEWAVEGWSAVKLFATVMDGKTKGVPSSSDVLAAFNAISKPVQLDSVGPFGKPPAKPYVPKYDRMFSPWVQNGVVKNGVVEPDGKNYVNPFTQTV
jgi:ABC-type branched-subunit amino acid transport system substrate-binding protein